MEWGNGYDRSVDLLRLPYPASKVWRQTSFFYVIFKVMCSAYAQIVIELDAASEPRWFVLNDVRAQARLCVISTSRLNGMADHLGSGSCRPILTPIDDETTVVCRLSGTSEQIGYRYSVTLFAPCLSAPVSGKLPRPWTLSD